MDELEAARDQRFGFGDDGVLVAAAELLAIGGAPVVAREHGDDVVHPAVGHVALEVVEVLAVGTERAPGELQELAEWCRLHMTPTKNEDEDHNA